MMNEPAGYPKEEDYIASNKPPSAGDLLQQWVKNTSGVDRPGRDRIISFLFTGTIVAPASRHGEKIHTAVTLIDLANAKTPAALERFLGSRRGELEIEWDMHSPHMY